MTDPLGPARLAENVMRTWSLLFAEDLDDNGRRAYGTGKRIELARENWWHLVRAEIGLTRREPAATLVTITGQAWPEPRWPDFVGPLKTGTQ